MFPYCILCFTAPARCCTLAVNSPLLLANSPPHYVSLLYTVLHRTCAVLYLAVNSPLLLVYTVAGVVHHQKVLTSDTQDMATTGEGKS
eukprot:1182871-Prorocentrum_minimum.AAC.1